VANAQRQGRCLYLDTRSRVHAEPPRGPRPVLTLALTGCGSIVAGPDDPQPYPQSDATSADYQVVVDASDAVLTEAGTFVPTSVVASTETAVADLETDRHRMPCGDTTSFYTNTVDYYLTAGTGEIVIIDELRDSYVSDGCSAGKPGRADG
jgi:hypothetical protein